MENTNEQTIISRLDKLIQLTEDIIIIQAVEGGFNKQELRKQMGVAMERITKISKYLKKKPDDTI